MKKIIILLTLLLLLGCSSSTTRDSKISKHFTFKEAIYSDTAKKYKIKNIPNNSEYKNIVYAAKRMDEIKKALKTEIYVTSWFRSEKVNKKVGGSKNSYHLKGLAVDFKTDGK
ncbi:MAG: D-Ala-D-Ala carboxypeptidase family metallohydrolase, partial [Cetobacterium sp.]